MAAVWKKPVNGSPRSAATAPSSRQALLASDQGWTPRGYVPMVLVGDEEGSEERIMVHVEMLKEPCMAAVLEMAAQQFGYGQPGVLRIPCIVDRFQQMVGGACEAR
ncbi:auxin-responsive protein SAUR71-like [Miscanthus floridulus]|uniref:auxin-responsive protein SAUR71-like n=1 Tax=Miscanthus floridulus TaxID=154761 RepID=UPI00345B2AA1